MSVEVGRKLLRDAFALTVSLGCNTATWYKSPTLLQHSFYRRTVYRLTCDRVELEHASRRPPVRYTGDWRSFAFSLESSLCAIADADTEHPMRPTHLLNGVSPLWNSSNLRDPCAECGHCSACKCHKGGDWTPSQGNCVIELNV